jgi:hypothetical protein
MSRSSKKRGARVYGAAPYELQKQAAEYAKGAFPDTRTPLAGHLDKAFGTPGTFARTRDQSGSPASR